MSEREISRMMVTIEILKHGQVDARIFGRADEMGIRITAKDGEAERHIEASAQQIWDLLRGEVKEGNVGTEGWTEDKGITFHEVEEHHSKAKKGTSIARRPKRDAS